jgi:hypothetical protein
MVKVAVVLNLPPLPHPLPHRKLKLRRQLMFHRQLLSNRENRQNREVLNRRTE